MKQVLLSAVTGAWLAIIFIGYPLMLVVTARRPANDRDAFIHKLPPPSQLATVREAYLHMLVRQEMLKQVKIAAVLAVVVVVLGLSIAVSDHAPIGVEIAGTAFVAVSLSVFYAIVNGLYLFARYRSARLRIHQDAEWHTRGEQSSAVPTDA
jgi:hypothetical protein